MGLLRVPMATTTMSHSTTYSESGMGSGRRRPEASGFAQFHHLAFDDR